ncbi:ABC transporter substrate-binding protein (plasmid) [Rhizobium sp. RCAM05350]|uniref:ABC transporter substrate-binding protein n=1 Tax=Rhizobium sp. RCAM05350 TaxID=2895568 RepID=UPI0020769F9B|nr:ABC transporter substrate-binding protein [Rhizobium sp. RCAM05350]URK89435.1 ABC transporter substrate-binding protein [Rhizobium sp. RCAM05350]
MLFHDGSALTAKDVAATFNRHADPAIGSNALSALQGILSTGGAVATDDTTVEFTLDAPYGNFPYTASSDNYNCIILKNGDNTDFASKQNGTGPWKLQEVRTGRGVTYVRNDAYWGPAPNFDQVAWTYYDEIGAAILAIQSGAAELLTSFPTRNGAALFRNPKLEVISFASSTHQPIHMRTDVPPFNDTRIRRAVAMTIDRSAIVKALFNDKAEIGNDTPFSQLFASTDKSVPQRIRDIPAAKALMAEAGVPDGFSVDLLAQKSGVAPELVVLVQDQLKEIGINVNIVQMGVDQYFGDLKFGTSPMLDSPFGIDDYGHRGIPNVFLFAQLSSSGPWNASHFKNPTYDGLMAEYFAATDLKVQQEKAGDMQRLLLEETPQLNLYFYNFNVVHSLSHNRRRADRDGAFVPRRSRVRRMNSGVKALLRRGGLSLLSLLLLSFIIFFVIQVMPGDVGRRILGSMADQRSVDKLNEALGVNRPVIVQYLEWVGNFVRGISEPRLSIGKRWVPSSHAPLQILFSWRHSAWRSPCPSVWSLG